jgi:hypothetical protein
MTKTSALEVLAPIWQRVLELPSIPVNAHSFHLEGDPSIINARLESPRQNSRQCSNLRSK